MYKFDFPPFFKKPGIVLGPWDALTAIMLWMKECTNENSSWRSESRNLKFARITPEHRSRLYRGFLLFGAFDGLNGIFPSDAFLRRFKIYFSRREIFGDLESDRYAKYSPFAHSLEQGFTTGIMNSKITASPEDIKRLTASVSRILRKIGCKIITENDYLKIEPNKRRSLVFKEEISGQIKMLINGQIPLGVVRTVWPKYLGKQNIEYNHVDIGSLGLAPVQYISHIILAAVAALERSVSSSTPLMSVDTAGPAWLTSSNVNKQLSIFKLVFEEVNWLPQPRNFHEAFNMFNDDRMVSLRDNIHYLFEMFAVGDVSHAEEIRQNIKKSVKSFKSKSWASNICQIITYIAVPTSIAEALMGSIGFGLGAGFVGAASQLISDAMDNNKQKSWLSIGRDLI